jgi:sortase A
VAGLVGIGIWGWSVAGKTVYQDWGNWAFERQVHGEKARVTDYLRWRLGLAPEAEKREEASHENPAMTPPAPSSPIPTPAPPPPKDSLLGRLSIPRLDMHVIVREGVDDSTLRIAAGHIPGTALPGQVGNVGVAAHRDTLFRGLKDIHRNDLIRFETAEGSHEYRVESTRIVTPKEVSVLASHQSPELTLVTCYPFYYVGSAPDRFIVKAREVTADAASQATAPALAASAAEPGPEPAADVKESNQEAAKEQPPPHKPAERATAEPKPAGRRVAFEIVKDHSRQLVPGISMGITGTDASSRRVDGWMWVMPDRRTIWLRDHSAYEPVVFYGGEDGKMRELVITSVAHNSVKGYLILPDSGARHHEHARSKSGRVRKVRYARR